MAKIINDTNKTVKQANRIVKGIDKISAEVAKQSKKIKAQSIDKAIDLNKTKSPFIASSLVARDVDNNLKAAIDNINSDFKEFIIATESYLASNFAIKLTKKNLEVIARKESAIIEELVNNTSILKSDIQEILTQNLAQGITTKQLVRSFADLYPAYERNAGTIINTGIGRLYVDINVSKFADTGFKWYIWAGPDDSITREVPCKHWVWHRFPASELSAISQVRQTLWNCRHSIIPIPENEKDNYPRGSLELAQ